MQLNPFKFETVRVDGRGEVLERLQLEAQVFQQPLGGGMNLELVQLPGGLCQIGSPIHQGYDDEP